MQAQKAHLYAATLNLNVIFLVVDFRYFKYRPVSKHTIESLVNSTLYFARPDRLNDPFDCQIDIQKSARYAASKSPNGQRQILEKIATLENYLDEIQRRMAHVGICSFSLALDEPLLWSHYADEHRGVCLLYEFTEDYLIAKENKIVGVSEVSYGDNPLSNWFLKSIPIEIEDSFYEEFTIELLKNVLVVKGSGWHYEKEVRIIREEEGPFRIPRACLKQLCFGLNTSASDKKLVTRILESADYDITLCQIEMKESDFGIHAIEI